MGISLQSRFIEEIYIAVWFLRVNPPFTVFRKRWFAWRERCSGKVKNK